MTMEKTLHFRRVTLIAAALSVALAACGSSGNGTKATAGARTIAIAMHDIGYSPTAVDVKAGEKVSFVFHNTGKVDHDAFIGDEAAQTKHESEMSDMGGMHHGSGGAITVKPGKTGTLTKTFATAGNTLIGCHEAGHYAAGMKIDVRVS
jgi:uncharacterized cupredoxin-like copper-binding protein